MPVLANFARDRPVYFVYFIILYFIVTLLYLFAFCRAAAYREMVQCHACKKFVHGTCDPEADPLTYQQRKEAKPDYEYICQHCKSMAMVARRKDSIDEGDLSLSASQESLDGESSELDYPSGCSEEALYSVGLGKGKPFCATKIAKKRLGISGGVIGRPKGIGKLGYQKRQKMTEFGRKRGPKGKMRGFYGVPEVGLQVCHNTKNYVIYVFIFIQNSISIFNI